MEYILDNITIGDWLNLSDSIGTRKRREALLSLAIVHNPYSKDPNALFRELRGGRSYEYSDKIDRGSIDKLKKELKKSKVIKVKE